MDVNSGELSQKEFRELADTCTNYKDGWMCGRNKFACKDYLCPHVLLAKNVAEVRAKFAQQKINK
jgi:hypothetical protein